MEDPVERQQRQTLGPRGRLELVQGEAVGEQLLEQVEPLFAGNALDAVE